MDIEQIMRRWLAGEKIRAIARSTGTDRNTVRRIVHIADKEGIGQEAPPDEGKLQVIRQRMGRPGSTVTVSESEQRLKPRTEQIRAWLDKDHLLLSKVHELLAREGLAVSYSSLYRFARKWCEFGTASAISVRRAESQPGEVAEVDFGRLGALHELGSCRPRMVQGFLVSAENLSHRTFEVVITKLLEYAAKMGERPLVCFQKGLMAGMREGAMESSPTGHASHTKHVGLLSLSHDVRISFIPVHLGLFSPTIGLRNEWLLTYGQGAARNPTTKRPPRKPRFSRTD